MALPTPTIVRIKRRIGAESSESIIVSTKRKRLNEDESADVSVSDICSTIFKKLTTLKTDESLEIEAKKALANEPKHQWYLKENFKKGLNSSAKDLVQKKTKSDITAIRFKLICSKRDIDKSTPEEKSADDAPFHLFDALKEKDQNLLNSVPSSSKNTDLDVISCNGVPMDSEKVEFVYDLYYTSMPIELSSWIDNICEIQKWNELEYHEDKSNDNEIDDDDDENSESNWRNDYPDEEDGDFYGDEDDFLCAELQRKARLSSNDSNGSYDLEEYDESGDFDEDGNLVLYNEQNKSVFRRIKDRKLKIPSDSSDSD